MVNKKGFMRVVEATIAVFIVVGVLLILSPHKKAVQPEDPSKKISIILEEMAKNVTLREEILSERTNPASYISEKFNNSAFNIEVEICELNEPCFLVNYPDTESEMFSVERTISATIKNVNFVPKKIRVFAWSKF